MPDTVVACAAVPIGTVSQCPPPKAAVVQLVPTTVMLPDHTVPVVLDGKVIEAVAGLKVTVRVLHWAQAPGGEAEQQHEGGGEAQNCSPAAHDGAGPCDRCNIRALSGHPLPLCRPGRRRGRPATRCQFIGRST